jgi:hypothetical protein
LKNIINEVRLIIKLINRILNSTEGVNYLTNIKRIILDVLKPHAPSIIEVAERLGKLDGISGVNISLEEVDAETDSIKITIEGNNINYTAVEKEISECGAVIHSIDGVSAGMKIIDEVNTPQDR